MRDVQADRMRIMRMDRQPMKGIYKIRSNFIQKKGNKK